MPHATVILPTATYVSTCTRMLAARARLLAVSSMRTCINRRTVYYLLQTPVYSYRLLRSRRHRLLFVLLEVQGLLCTLLSNRSCHRECR